MESATGCTRSRDASGQSVDHRRLGDVCDLSRGSRYNGRQCIPSAHRRESFSNSGRSDLDADVIPGGERDRSAVDGVALRLFRAQAAAHAGGLRIYDLVFSLRNRAVAWFSGCVSTDSGSHGRRASTHVAGHHAGGFSC